MRVVIVDDNAVWRSSLVAALTSRGIRVVAETADGVELLHVLDAADGISVDVAILDLRLPPTWSDEGIHLADELRRRRGGIGIVILSGYEHDVQLHYATRAFHKLGSGGGVGYLFKDRTSRNDLREAVHRVAAGGVVVDPIFARHAIAEYRDRLTDQNDVDQEIDVLVLLLQGLRSTEIADELAIDPVEVDAALAAITRRVRLVASNVVEHQPRGGAWVASLLELVRLSGRSS